MFGYIFFQPAKPGKIDQQVQQYKAMSVLLEKRRNVGF